MALSVEVLAGIKLQLEARAGFLGGQAAELRLDAQMPGLPEESAEMRIRAAVWSDVEAAKVRGLIASVEEEMGREKADT